jgi:hypothetical protein
MKRFLRVSATVLALYLGSYVSVVASFGYQYVTEEWSEPFTVTNPEGVQVSAGDLYCSRFHKVPEICLRAAEHRRFRRGERSLWAATNGLYVVYWPIIAIDRLRFEDLSKPCVFDDT